MQKSFDLSYQQQYGRIIPGIDVEILNWTVTVSRPIELPKRAPEPKVLVTPSANSVRKVIDAASGKVGDYSVYARAKLKPGMEIKGPALIVEDETTTVVSPHFDANINSVGYIILNRRETG